MNALCSNKYFKNLYKIFLLKLATETVTQHIFMQNANTDFCIV